jgi:hypothetical protein
MLLMLAMGAAGASCAGQGTGGATGSGGSGSGSGGNGSGGNGSGGNGSGGSNASGGSNGSGGSTSTGGNNGSGGSTSTGGSNGSGGSTSTGGNNGSGGATASGGNTGSGGNASTGGNTGSGGNTSSGGNTGSGGSPATGGATGTGGSGAAGGAGGAATTGFCPSGAIFCADFEEASGVPMNNPVGTATFEDPDLYGSTFATIMALDKTSPFDGKQSLKVLPSTAQSSMGMFRTLAVAVPSAFWVRLYIKSDQAIGQPNHNSFFAAGTDPSYHSANNIEVSEQYGCVLLNKSDTTFPTGTTCGANTALSANAWHCLAVQFDGTAGNVQVFAGTTQIINAQGWAPAKEAINTLSFGYFEYNGGNATVWYDDVVVSTSPLSCPAGS